MDTLKQPLWRPRNVSNTNVAKFMASVNERHNLDLQSYQDLYEWSVADSSLQDFWGDAFDWLELAPPGHKRSCSMLDVAVSMPCHHFTTSTHADIFCLVVR